MPRLDLDAATALARSRVDQIAQAVGDHFEILPDQTKILERGWIFFFNTADYVRTRNPSSALAGNGPIFVTREGTIYELPSAIPWEEAVRRI
jgi:hypothetical protein